MFQQDKAEEQQFQQDSSGRLGRDLPHLKKASLSRHLQNNNILNDIELKIRVRMT